MNRKILHLGVASIISNITVPLLGLVDVAIVGHIGDASYIGAIAVGSMLFNVIYWLFGFLRMGTSGMTSQALGRRDFSEVQRLLVRSLSIGVGIGLLFFILQRWIIGCGLWAMSPEADVVELARRYCYVCIWGCARCAWTLWIHGLVYRYAEHPHPDGSVADAECGEHHRFADACLRLQDDGRRCGAWNGHRPMVGISDGLCALSPLLSQIGQV